MPLQPVNLTFFCVISLPRWFLVLIHYSMVKDKISVTTMLQMQYTDLAGCISFHACHEGFCNLVAAVQPCDQVSWNVTSSCMGASACMSTYDLPDPKQAFLAVACMQYQNIRDCWGSSLLGVMSPYCSMIQYPDFCSLRL